MIYVISTPIGNLNDLSKRAIDVLKSCDVIFAEDTRKASFLLSSIGLEGKSILIFNDYTKGFEKYFVEAQNKTVAIISDAGTPLICDPGARFLEMAKQRGIKVIPVPGCCAFVSALSVCGMVFSDFYFGGFFDIKKFWPKNGLFCFYIPARDLLKTLIEIKDKYQSCYQIKICIAREMTKIYEDIFTDSIENVIEYYKSDEKKLQGEAVMILQITKLENESDLDFIIKNIFKENKALNSTEISRKALCDLLLNYHCRELKSFSKKEIYSSLLNLKN